MALMRAMIAFRDFDRRRLDAGLAKDCPSAFQYAVRA